jgi:hypothetical protein
LIIGSPMYKPNTKMNDKDHILTQKWMTKTTY